jgi:hypothetical protein
MDTWWTRNVLIELPVIIYTITLLTTTVFYFTVYKMFDKVRTLGCLILKGLYM